MPAYAIVIISIAAVIFVISVSRVKACFIYEDDADFYIKYLFLKFRISKKPKKADKIKKQKGARKKLSMEQIGNFISLFERIKDDVEKAIVKVKNRLRIDLLDLNLTIGGEDAAVTALTYGKACAVIYPSVSVLNEIIKIKNQKILINADFNGNNKIDFKFTASMSVGAILGVAVTSGVKILFDVLKKSSGQPSEG